MSNSVQYFDGIQPHSSRHHPISEASLRNIAQELLDVTVAISIVGFLSTTLMLSLTCLPFERRYRARPFLDNTCTASSTFLILLSCFNAFTDTLYSLYHFRCFGPCGYRCVDEQEYFCCLRQASSSWPRASFAWLRPSCQRLQSASSSAGELKNWPLLSSLLTPQVFVRVSNKLNSNRP